MLDRPLWREAADASAGNTIFATPLGAAIAPIGLFGVALANLVFAHGHGGAAPLWIADGMLLALLLTTPRELRFVYLLGGIAAMVGAAYAAGLPVDDSLRLGALDVGEALIAVLLLERFMGTTADLSRPEDFRRFALLAGTAAPALATLLALAARLLAGEPSSPALMLTLFLAHGLGITMITPLALGLLDGTLAMRIARADAKFLAAFAALVLATIGVFLQTRYPLIFVLQPLLALLVLTGGFETSLLGLLVAIGIADAFTDLGFGPGRLIPHAAPGESMVVVQAFQALSVAVASLLAALRAEREKLAASVETLRRDIDRLAATDALTGLANRDRMTAFLDDEFRRASRHGTPLAVVLIEMDQFERFNERYGHPAGDACLKRAAGVLRDLARRPGDLVARYGGAQFVMVLGLNEPDAAAFAEKARARIAALAIAHSANKECGGLVTASFGVAALEKDGAVAWPETLIRAADRRLFEAKQAGRNRVMPTPIRKEPVLIAPSPREEAEHAAEA